MGFLYKIPCALPNSQMGQALRIPLLPTCMHYTVQFVCMVMDYVLCFKTLLNLILKSAFGIEKATSIRNIPDITIVEVA